MMSKLIKRGGDYKKHMLRKVLHGGYRLARPVVFCFNSETVHELAISFGEFLGKSRAAAPVKWCLEHTLPFTDPSLSQTIAGIHFANPLGLAAGFDYEARLTQINHTIGFAFITIGTITNLPYEGNKKPRLGRLVQSRSLVVNKGFKNLGVDVTLARLAGLHRHFDKKNLASSSTQSTPFSIPVGISIGKTNTLDHTTQQQAIDDIVSAFTKVETNLATTATASADSLKKVPFSYYELNISCPNLRGTIEFYSPAHLEELLTAVFELKLTLPVFIKMPIVKTNEEILAMLAIIVRFPPVGVIIGNLFGDRTLPLIVQKELVPYPKGGLSGMATQARSDELIALVYKNFGTRFVIIGCGGVFSATDAYRKIRSGASLVQFITGMIFEGPQLPASINEGLAQFLKKDGFSNIAQAVGANFK